MQNKERKVFRRMRKGLRIPLAQLAKETGIYRTKLSAWEIGKTDLTPDERFKIGEAIDAVLMKRGIPGVVTPEQATEDLRKGTTLARLRDQYGVTQSSVAKMAKIPQSIISAFEQGHVELSPAQIETLFKALNEVLAERETVRSRVSLASLPKLSKQKKSEEQTEKKELLAELDKLKAQMRKIEGEIARLEKGEWTH